MSEMISFGAGVNSVAMTIMLVEEGWRGPIVFADPGGEMPETYCYIEYFEQEYLKAKGLEIVRLIPSPEYHSKRAQQSLEKYCLQAHIIPMLAVRWCSVDWKRKPIQRWVEKHGYEIQLLGISADEPRRVRYDPIVRYPLVEAGVTRKGCYRIIHKAGLEPPVKSGCFFCPGRTYAQWRDLHYEHPDLYERAIALEDNCSQHHDKYAALNSNGKNLRDMLAARWQGQMQMDLSQWLPCVCRL